MATYNIQSGDTLSGIAQSNNTTIANLMSANPNITDANKISAGGSLNIPTISPVGALPNSNVVNVNTIAKPQSGINVPPTPTVTDTTSTVANAQDAIKNLQAEQLKINQDIATAQQQKLDPLYQQQLALQAQITGKGADQLQMEQTAGLAEKRQQLSNLNASIAQQTAKFNAEQYSFSANGNPTLASISRKDDAIQLAMLTAAAQGIQGNITAAETSIQNAIKLKYDDIEKKLQYTQDFITKNEAIMTEAQKKVATDRSAQITSQIAQIQKDKEDMTSLITNAVAQGAPTSLTQKAALAKTPLEAAQILGAWAGDYWKLQSLKSQLETDALQRAKIRADMTPSGNVVINNSQYTKEQYTAGEQAGKIKNILSDINTAIKNNKGFQGAVGAGFQKLPIVSWFVGDETSQFGSGTDARTFDLKVQQLKNALALPNLSSLKGAMSDKDIMFLKNIATSLDTGMTEKEFKKELANIDSSLKNVEKKYNISLSDFVSSEVNMSSLLDKADSAIKNANNTTTTQMYKSGYQFTN
jgi:LysM repeat protein